MMLNCPYILCLVLDTPGSCFIGNKPIQYACLTAKTDNVKDLHILAPLPTSNWLRGIS